MPVLRGVLRVGGFAAVALGLLAGTLARAQSAQTYATILSLGDSLSDTGNNPPTGDYFEGRWSNGLLWDEYLAADFGAGLQNVAYAGSETSDLARQAEQAGGFSLDFNTTLCTVWSGANDFIDGATNGLNSEAWDRLVSKAAANISGALDALASSGARHILVVNLPDLSKTPGGLALPASFQTFVRGKVVLFNTRLEAALVSYRKANPQVRLASVDAFGLLDQVLADPAADGFTNVTSDALADFVNPAFNGPAADYLFWDQIHPTTKAHELFSQWTTNALAASPPVIVEEPLSQRAVAGSNVVFTVQASGATAYQWRFRGHSLAGATNQSYSIDAVRPSNAGAYSVIARNAYGSVASTNAVLTVILPPKILKQPASLAVPDGKTARFRVLAAGTAPLRYQWQWDDAPLPGATNAVLTLLDVQTNQAGTYSVLVTNVGGYATSSNAVLTVESGPGRSTQAR
jgi:phospholipase/lecithinase/hemolysin